MSELKINQMVHLTNGQTVTIKKLLGDGGQGYVYLVDMAGKEMALKWYKKSPSINPDAFYKNLVMNASNGAPSPIFIWPKYVTQKEYGSFGYIMEVRPQGYYEFVEFILCKQKFSSFLALTTTAIDICEGFRALHAVGLSYQDLNDGNFFINPQTGHVLICDNDNAFPYGMDSGILGKPRYMAPEVVVGTTLPNVYTDKFSLSVILFLLFYMNHPFEGKKYVSVPCMTPEREKKFYGSEILFICDSKDTSNEPVRGMHNNVIKRWPLLPAVLRRVFTEEFSRNKLFVNPTSRFTELQWLETITSVRDSLVHCPHCGEETFVKCAPGDNMCMDCGKQIHIANILSFNDRSIPLTRDSSIFLDRDDVPDLRVIVDADGDLLLQNLTSCAIAVNTTKGTVKNVEAKGYIPIKTGLVLHINVRGSMCRCEIK